VRNRRFIAACALLAASPAGAEVCQPSTAIAAPPDNAVPSGRAVALTLAETVALGLRDNRAIKSATLERVAQKFDLFVATTRFRPRIDIAGDIGHSRVAGVSGALATVTPTLSWQAPTGAQLSFSWQRSDRLDPGPHVADELMSFSLRQPLLRGAGFAVNLAPIRLARIQEQINRLGLKTNVSNVVSAIVLSYRSLLQAQEQVRLAEASLDRARDLLTTNRALIDAGRMAAADIVQTESSVANQEVTVLQARQSRASAQLALLQLLAADPRTNIVASDGIAVDHVEIDLDRLIELGLRARMDVLAARRNVEQSRISLSLARNQRLWDVSLAGTVSRHTGTDTLLNPIDSRPSRSVGLQLNIPIGDFTLRQAEIRADTSLRESELNYADQAQAAESQIRDAVQRVEASWQQLQAARRARKLAQQALEIQQERLKVGRASNFEVLSFQSDLRSADAQELSAGVAYLNELTGLDQQVGSTLDTWQIALND
jgi:outer membrane protein TolC